MLSNITASGTNSIMPASPRIHSPSTYGSKTFSYLPEEDHPKMGKRFPGVGRPKAKKKKRNVTVVYEEGRSHSVDRGKCLSAENLKKGRSTQSLVFDPNEDQSDNYFVKSIQQMNKNKISVGLKAIRMLPKNILMKKMPRFRSKLNSDSSSVQGDESEVDSLSDWPISRESPRDDVKKSSKYRTSNDCSYYGLDRVLEVKETTLSPPGTPKPEVDELRINEFRASEYEDEKNVSSESSSSESSTSEDTSLDSSRTLPTIRRASVRKKSVKKNFLFKAKGRGKGTQSEESDASPKKYATEEKKRKRKGPPKLSGHPVVPSDPKPEANTTNDGSANDKNEPIPNVKHDAACPQINVVCYDHDHNGTACSLASCNNSHCLMSSLQKSKSATALDSYPSHECERALSSVLIAPDYKEHGPCLIPPSRNDIDVDRILTGATTVASSQPANPQVATVARSSQSPGKVTSVPCMHRRSSDSDLSITPKGNSLTGSDRSSGVRDGHGRQPASLIRPSMNQESLDMLEYPFLTMSKYPPGFIQHLGGTVNARSVKLLERITNLEEPETRDAWWTELRMEVRSHTRAMGCNVVIGYSENTSICDDVCVLSASGTAALINLNAPSDSDVFSPQHPPIRTAQHQKEPPPSTDAEKDGKSNKQGGDAPVPPSTNPTSRTRDTGQESFDLSSCTVCHIPYSETSVPFRVNMQKCAICRRGKVPDVLFTTIDLIDNIPTVGKGSFIHAYVCRPKRDCKGEMNAKEISDGLPFLEYELHRLLINKLKVRGMNTIFGLKVQVSIGEKMLIGLATGTAAFLTALPTPPVPKVSAGNSWNDSKKLCEIQKQLQETVKKNRDFYQLRALHELDFHINGRHVSEDTDESDDDLPELDLSLGNKDTCIMEVDDAEDADIVSLLIDPRPPDGFHVVNTETVPGLDDLEVVKNLQMFTQVWRAKIPLGQPLSAFNQHFNRLLQSVYFKLRNMVPCALSDLQFKITLEQDEIQLSLLGMALGLGEMDVKKKKIKNRLMPSLSRETVKKIDDSDMIFNLEEDNVTQNKTRNRSPVRTKTLKHMPPRSRYGVDITPLSYVPGGKIERYLGNLNFFFIRESTCIREGGGLGGFIHSFITEVLAIVRAHVTALGGNAMVAYFMTECFLYHYPHKNQGQCLINVGGDVVYISYFPED
ncbi:UNVERIFIED_CONTAM: hypothetical protein PYX00_003686 [Menopon gallinae]